MADLLNKIKGFVDDYFKVSILDFILAIKINYSAQGYIYGAISELLLRRYLRKKGYEVKRIKEKPKGGAKGKSSEARGDFYIRKSRDEKWLVVECKGLKSNSETADQIANLTTKEKL